MLSDPRSENGEARTGAGWMAVDGTGELSLEWAGRGYTGLKWLRKGAILDGPALSSFQTSFTILSSCAFSLGQSHSVLRFPCCGLREAWPFSSIYSVDQLLLDTHISRITGGTASLPELLQWGLLKTASLMMKPVFIGCLLWSGQGTDSVGINSLSLEVSREKVPFQRQWPSGTWSRLSSPWTSPPGDFPYSPTLRIFYLPGRPTLPSADPSLRLC